MNDSHLIQKKSLVGMTRYTAVSRRVSLVVLGQEEESSCLRLVDISYKLEAYITARDRV